MIVITTIDTLPDYCYECPCHDGESGYCQADKERRYSEYRPYWCPLKEIQSEVHELTREEWEHWKNAKNRNPICMIYKQDDTHTPIWVLDPNKVHEPALLMGEIKLFTGKPTFKQCKEMKWE